MPLFLALLTPILFSVRIVILGYCSLKNFKVPSLDPLSTTIISAGLCEAAAPLIDLGGTKTPFISTSQGKKIIEFNSRPNIQGKNRVYFDPEPECNLSNQKHNFITDNRNYVPVKTFRLLLENGNTGESYLYSIASSFFNNQIDYGFFDYFFRDWRENKEIKMDRGVVNNFLKICENLVGTEKTLNVIITSGYRTLKTNEYLRKNSSQVAKNSMHLSGRAIDFAIKNKSIGKLEKVADFLTPGGLGIYSGFIHIDTGPHRRWKA